MIYADRDKSHPNYENFIAECPHCGHENVFNRISDLGTTEPIDHKLVRCFNKSCEQEFGINGDIIRASYLAIFFDCYALYKEKRYSSCILLLAQSLEVFFYHYLRVELIYRPFWKQDEHDTDRANQVLTSLEKKAPDDESLSVLDSKLAKLLIDLKNCEIASMRNQVVHKKAYCPKREEVDAKIAEVRKILIKIGSEDYLNVEQESINDYQLLKVNEHDSSIP